MTTETTPGASRYASRKFQLAAVALLAIIVFFALGRLTEDAFTNAIQWTLGLYFGANVAQKATAKTET